MADRPPIDPWEGVAATIVHADFYPPAPDWRIDRQVCGYDGVFYVWKGFGWVSVDDERLEARPGDLFLLRRGSLLAAGQDRRRTLQPLSTGFHLRRAGTADPLRSLALPRRLRLEPGERAVVQERFMELIAAHHDPATHARLAAAGALLRLVAEALRLAAAVPDQRRTAPCPPPAGDDTMAARVQAWIDARLAEPLTLAALARVARLTPTRFAAAFRSQTGVAPMRWLRRRRVEAARALLAAGDAAVEEVARAVGFADPFHFSRVFRAEVGVAPRDYRHSLRHPFQP